MDQRATLHLFCGKIGSGKSTLAAQLAADPGTIIISEDQLLANLYPGEIVTLDDYVRCSNRLRRTIAPHIVDVLRKGMSIALDFQANTTAVRAWNRGSGLQPPASFPANARSNLPGKIGSKKRERNA